MVSNIHIKCNFCHRDKMNYTQGNFFLLNFKKNKKINKYKIIMDNQKWFCDIHYPKFYNYKELTWNEALDKVTNNK